MIQYHQPVTQIPECTHTNDLTMAIAYSFTNHEQEREREREGGVYKCTRGCCGVRACAAVTMRSVGVCAAATIKRNSHVMRKKRLMYVYFKRLQCTKSILPC